MDPASCLPRTPTCRQSRPVSGVPVRVSVGLKGPAPIPLQQTSIPGQCLPPGSPLSLCSCAPPWRHFMSDRSEEHTSELQSLAYLVCRLLLEKKKKTQTTRTMHLTKHINTVTRVSRRTVVQLY